MDEARYLEECLIAFLGRRSKGPLTNCTAGGDKNPMDDPAIRRKQKRKAGARLRKLHADPVWHQNVLAKMRASHTPEWREKVNATLRILRKTKASRKAFSERALVAMARPEVKEKLRQKTLTQFANKEMRERHRLAVLKAMNRPEVKMKMRARTLRALFTP